LRHTGGIPDLPIIQEATPVKPEAVLTIDIISDVMCPWCFIGKRRLEEALKQRPDQNIEINWRPYLLNPDMPKDGMDRQQYLTTKFGGAENARATYAPIEEAGHGEGIAFAFDAIERSPNTVDAHRLIRWARDAGCQDEIVEQIFRAYFTEGRNIGDHDVLIDIAGKVGMDRDTVRNLLSGEQDRAEVLAEIQTAKTMGVSGVPCFIVGGKYAVMGAQPAEVLLGAMDRAASEATEDNPA